MNKVLVITGATAVGKTALALDLAEQFKGEIINADSQQVYQELNIGTAKVDQESKMRVVHHGLDIIGYDQSYSVKAYQDMARSAITHCHNTSKLPILVGGSGLYLKASLYDYDFEADIPKQPELDLLSNEVLYQKLQQLDYSASEKIHPNNRKRVLRALNLALSGQSKTQREAKQNKQLIYDVLFIVLDRHRANMHQRIEQRVEEMFEQGLKQEVMRYFKEPHTWRYQSFQAIGYKEWKAYFEHGISEEEVKQAIILATRQYAKRQVTWFRHQFEGHWFNLDEISTEDLYRTIQTWLDKENT